MLKCGIDESLVEFKKSAIHGRGMISRVEIVPGAKIAVIATPQGKITRRGRWVNHSYLPNARVERDSCLNGAYVLRAVAKIEPGDEITANYDDTPDFIGKARAWFK